MEKDVLKSGTRRPGRKSGTSHLGRDALAQESFDTKSKNILLVMSEVYFDVTEKYY